MIVILIEKNMDVQDEQDLRLTLAKNAKSAKSTQHPAFLSLLHATPEALA